MLSVLKRPPVKRVVSVTWTCPLSRWPARDYSNWFESQYFLGRSNIMTGWHRFSGPEMFSTQQPEAVGSCSALCSGCQTLLPKTRVCSVLFSQPRVFWPASFPFSLFTFLSLVETTGKNSTRTIPRCWQCKCFFESGPAYFILLLLFFFDNSPGTASWWGPLIIDVHKINKSLQC